MAESRILKFDVGSNTDVLLTKIKQTLDAGTGIEAMRRSLAIADVVTEQVKTKKKKLFVQGEDGKLQEIFIS